MLDGESQPVRKIVRRKPQPGDYGYPANPKLLSDKAAEVTQRLLGLYGIAEWSRKDPLSMLVNIVLSHRTKDEETAAAYANLKARFDTWEALQDEPTAEVEEAIAGVNWPEVKAPRLQEMMRLITAERGELNLDFLRDLPVQEGEAWLKRLHGVGPKTRACVLLFSCRKPILPVDTHVHRVSIRLGLIGPKVTAEAAHPLLQALLPQEAQTIYNFHKSLLMHGKRVCVYDRPRCQNCPLTDLCNYYNTVVKPKPIVEAAPLDFQPPLFDFQ